MKINKTIIVLIVAFFVHISSSFAQDNKDEINSLKPGNSNFMLRGYAHFGLDVTKDETTFNPGSFNPVFLWRHGSKFLFESEWELEFEGNDLSIGLEYTDVSYIVSKGLVIRAGKFLLPFGAFSERLHPAWINRFVSKPLGFTHHGGIAPMSDVGIEVRGGIQAGRSKLNYSLYIVNGPTINDGTEEAEEAGMLHFDNIVDNNKNKAIGGRIGFLPFSNSSLEVGISDYYAKPGTKDSPFEGDPTLEDINYKNVTANLVAIDLSFVKSISGLKGIVDIKGQYNSSNVSSATFYNSEDSTRYTFDNNSSAYYGQISYRPALVSNETIKNFEIVGRYSAFTTPDGALWGSERKQWAVGLNYWFTWRTALKLSYQSTEINREGIKSTLDEFAVHIAVGF